VINWTVLLKMIGQAGHETTGNTLSWILFELSKHQNVQDKVRDEIRATRAKAGDRGDEQLSISDLESMSIPCP
jgi:cytochrome P450